MKKIAALSALALGLAGLLAPGVASASDGAQPGVRAVNATVNNQGNPNAVPPILPPVRPSELAEIRRAEAQERQHLYYRLPARDRYSNAAMNVFAAEGYGRAA